MPQPIPIPKHTTAVVESFWVGERRYISRYADCGKKNCSKCGGSGPRRASHGPYWYLCFTELGRWKQVYLGKDLDTRRFITDKGNLDLPAIKASRHPRPDPVPDVDRPFPPREPGPPLLTPLAPASVPDPDPGPVPDRD